MGEPLMLHEIQLSIKDELKSNVDFTALVTSLLGEDFNYSIDMSEVDRPILPAFIVHKLYSDYAIGDSSEFILQFNLSCLLGDYQNEKYDSIINLEKLVKKSLEVSDATVCKYGLVRIGTRIRFPDTIGVSDDVEAIVSVVYSQETTELF